MLPAENKPEYYQALLDKNKEYEGLFFVCVKTTEIFCHSIYSAKKPKFENCEFYKTVQEALLASFMKKIRAGQSVIEVQLDTGYESSSGFRDAFFKIMGAAPTNFNKHRTILKASWLDTPLGSMLAVASEEFLYLLEFVDRRSLESEIKKLRNETKSAIIPGITDPIKSISQELEDYFLGTLKKFKTPLYFSGTTFQKQVWNVLIKIPYGQTRSYKEQAHIVGNDLACRAVANANGANRFAIIIPCHRVINTNGNLGGYSAGIDRKKWLLDHEKKYLKK